MTTYMQSLRTKTIHQAKIKLSKHRDLGEQSNLNIFQVADLMDRIHNASKKVEDTNSVFFSVSMN
jgi:hypothetical protein